MGKIQILTQEQKNIISAVVKSDYLQSQFYFTGGTALSAVYFQHRYSEDLDFFSIQEFDNQIILTLMEDWKRKYKFTFTSEFREVVYMFNLTFQNDEILKVDFGKYPYKQIEKGRVYEGISVDSLLDIAVNKLLTITQRTNVKDFVDLYFLLQDFTVWDLMEGVRVKFNMKLEPFIVATDFLKVEDFDYLPKMIKPLSLEELQVYFRKRAKEMGKISVE